MDLEECKMLQKIAEEVDKKIDKILERYSIDRAFFNFKLSVDVLDSIFSKMEEKVLIDDGVAFCAFCGTKTQFYDSKRSQHVCVKCFSTLEKKT